MDDRIIFSILVSLVLFIILLIKYTIFQKNKSIASKYLYNSFIVVLFLLIVHCLGLILQIMFKNTEIKPIYFDYITYVSGIYTPIAYLVFAISFAKGKVNFKKMYPLLIVPAISLIILWTNDFHNLFFKVYSTNIEEMVFGNYFYIYSIYSYICVVMAMIILVKAVLKKSGFFSTQTMLIILGCLIPIVQNILATFRIIPTSIYITPVLFTATVSCLAIAIIKYKALDIIPVAYKSVMDTMSDAFVVISANGTIVEKNATFNKLFANMLTDNNFSISIKDLIDVEELKNIIDKIREENTVIKKEYHLKRDKLDKYFEVDINPIKEKKGNDYIATLLLFRDITQHKLDMQVIEKQAQMTTLRGTCRWYGT